MRLSLTLALFLALASACISIPDIELVEPDPASPDSGTPDSGQTQGADAGTDGGAPTSLGVRVLSPERLSYTRGVVQVALEVQGEPNSVELLVDQATYATLQAPYLLDWDTTLSPEGPHTLQVRVTRGTEVMESEVHTVVVDRTPPTVVARTPSPGAENVAVAQAISVTFSEPILEATLLAEHVRFLVNEQPHEASRQLSVDGLTLTLTPVERVPVPSTVTTELTEGITDYAGNALVVPSEAWSWTAPALLLESTFTLSTGNPTPLVNMTLDASGHPILSHTSNFQLFVHQWTGADWVPLSKAPVITGNFGFGHPLIQHRDGTTFMGVSTPNNQRFDIYRKVEDQWVGLGAPLSVNQSPAPASLHLGPAMQLGVAVSTFDPTRLEVHLQNNTEWELVGAPIQPSSGSFTPVGPSLQLEINGRHVVAWVEAGNGDFGDVYVNRWNGTTWAVLGGKLNVLSHPTNQGRNPSLQLGAEGLPWVAWSGAGPQNTQHIYVHRWNGFTWTQLGIPFRFKIPTNSAGDTLRPILRLDPSGNAFIAWAEEHNGRTSVHLTRWNGQSWELIGSRMEASQARWTNSSMELDPAGRPVITSFSVDVASQANRISLLRFNQ
ncbi:Ig-like domain-containing protein [Myxococcus sp. MISCRS1]|uniref:Ig-like domain-containing protein n=1 Tax=Myxococcus sp. MISCRS1 TaxID=2996786 RepID=UPI00226EEE5D|nr:Ig-like domain-containing protein [Myxococcus sp. MISCRS1]MCY0999099.1 Ig-like domain-containing protein [Myxococcus sp. MISCRS1]